MNTLDTDFPRKYRLSMRQYFRHGSWKYEWTLVGRHGGVHLHISGPHRYDNEDHWSAGLETHWRQPPEYMDNDPPSHDECWLLKCPCWHDGTSLYAQEHLLPMFFRGDNNAIFRELVMWADDKLGAPP